MTTDFRFLRIADEIRHQIETGVLQPGERLPSVRTLSRERQVSITTASRAYLELEMRGLVTVRPQSGYYVRPRHSGAERPSQPTRPALRATSITVREALQTLAKGWSNAQVVDFSVAVPALSLLPRARLNKTLLAAVRALPDSGIGYDYSGGLPELRRQVARLMGNGKSQVTAEAVVVTNGCIEALELALRATTQLGDVVAIESPAYYGILQVMEGLGLKALELPTHPHTGPDLTTLEKALSREPIRAVLLTPSFSNPLGYCLPDDRKEELVALLARYDLPLIEDDIYGELYYGRQRPRTCHSFDRAGRVLLCSSVSKTLAPGYRIGWLLPGRYAEAVSRVRLMETLAPATLTQATVAEFMRQRLYERHLRQLRATLQRQVLEYSQLLAESFPAGTRVSEPTGGLVLWVELPEERDVQDLLNRAVAAGITFFPGYLFTAQPQYRNCLRVSCGQPLTPPYRNGIRQLGQFLTEGAGRG